MAIFAELDSALSDAFEGSIIKNISSNDTNCDPVSELLRPDGGPIIVD